MLNIAVMNPEQAAIYRKSKLVSRSYYVFDHISESISSICKFQRSKQSRDLVATAGNDSY